MGRSRRGKGAGLQRLRTVEAPKRRSTRSPKLSQKAAAQQAGTGTSQDDPIKAYSSGSDMETEKNEEEEEESSGDEAPSPMEEDEEEWSGDEALAPAEDEEDEMDEDESDGDEAWVVSKPKTRRAPAKRKTPAGRKHARKGKDPNVAAERRRATEAMLEKLDIDGLSEIDDGTRATIELESGVTLECSVSQALLDALWSKCEELKVQIEALVLKYERQLGEKIIVSLPRVTTLEALLSLETVMYMH